MTLEEKAEEYAQNLEKELMKEYEEHSEYGQTSYLATIPTPHAKQAYLAGAKENEIVWHDLRKDPNDLPKEDCEVIIKCLGEEEDTWKFFSAEGFPIKTIAWCEKPQFKG